MKLLLWTIIVLVAAVAVGLVAKEDPGYVMIEYRDWIIESSLILFVLALILLFTALYLLIRLWAGTRSTPRLLRRWRARRKRTRAQTALRRAMVAMAERRWGPAERYLTERPQDSETPLVNYLLAARAAHEQGDNQRRDEYLRLAHQTMPKADIAIAIAQAEFQLDEQQLEQALATLNHLQQIAPKHPQVWELRARLYAQLEDWDQLLALLPELRSRRVLGRRKADQIEHTAYRRLLHRAVAQNDVQALQQVWQRIPKQWQRDEDLVADYGQHLRTVGGGDQAEPLLRAAIQRRWSQRLVYLYGLIDGPDPAVQLNRAEQWLRDHPQDPVLLLTLGRLYLRRQLWGKARQSLEASLHIDAQPETYRELGILLEKLNEKNEAMACYRHALAMLPASREVAALGGDSNEPPVRTLLPAEGNS